MWLICYGEFLFILDLQLIWQGGQRYILFPPAFLQNLLLERLCQDDIPVCYLFVGYHILQIQTTFSFLLNHWNYLLILLQISERGTILIIRRHFYQEQISDCNRTGLTKLYFINHGGPQRGNVCQSTYLRVLSTSCFP